MYADFKHGGDARISTIHGPLARRRQRARITTEELPAYLAHHPSKSLFSPGLTSAITAGMINRSDVDVVNLHWTGYGTLSIRQLGRITKPVVWTLHDMWAATGGLNYDDDAPDARWRVGYNDTSPVGSERFDIERWVAKRKQRHWRTPRYLVTPSRWLAAVMRDSALLHDWPVTVIPNPVDVTQFAPTDKREARDHLGVSHEARLVVAVLGTDLHDPRKGFDLLVAALRQIHLPSVEIAIVGHAHAPADWPTDMPMTHWLGRLDDFGMVAAYNAADLVVVPSRQDNLPQTATEPQACGVPVVAFDVGGLADAVEHEVSGLLVPAQDPSALALAVERLLGDHALRQRFASQSRARAQRLWAPTVVGNAYAHLFSEVAL